MFITQGLKVKGLSEIKSMPLFSFCINPTQPESKFFPCTSSPNPLVFLCSFLGSVQFCISIFFPFLRMSPLDSSILEPNLYLMLRKPKIQR